MMLNGEFLTSKLIDAIIKNPFSFQNLAKNCISNNKYCSLNRCSGDRVHFSKTRLEVRLRQCGQCENFKWSWILESLWSED